MHKLFRNMQYADAVTENGMLTHTSTSDPCLDLFGSIGSARAWSEDQIIAAFSKALATDPLVAMRILFWARDIRGGQGERRAFRICLNYLNENHREYLERNIHLVPEYGRWDDVFHLENDLVLSLIKAGLTDNNGLCAKWLPRKGPFANKVRRFLYMTPKEYRKCIVELSKTVEQDMCANKWEGIEYSHVPSLAMNKYRKAFGRHDGERFGQFLTKVEKGEAKINAGTLYPYDLFEAYKRKDTRKAVEAQWKALPNYMEGNEFRVLPMCDVSGSMYDLRDPVTYKPIKGATPMSVSVSLGIYISERNVGPFKDAFMTFSNKPTLQYLKGSFYDRCDQLLKAHWQMNTNLEAAFDMLLNAAIKTKAAPNEMPNMILIISDMQFDRCTKLPNNTAFEMIKDRYTSCGYELPNVVFWNVNARVGQSPVKFDQSGTALISGCSPSILKTVLAGKEIDPVSIMMKTVMSERYEAVTV